MYDLHNLDEYLESFRKTLDFTTHREVLVDGNFYIAIPEGYFYSTDPAVIGEGKRLVAASSRAALRGEKESSEIKLTIYAPSMTLDTEIDDMKSLKGNAAIRSIVSNTETFASAPNRRSFNGFQWRKGLFTLLYRLAEFEDQILLNDEITEFLSDCLNSSSDDPSLHPIFNSLSLAGAICAGRTVYPFRECWIPSGKDKIFPDNWWGFDSIPHWLLRSRFPGDPSFYYFDRAYLASDDAYSPHYTQLPKPHIETDGSQITGVVLVNTSGTENQFIPISRMLNDEDNDDDDDDDDGADEDEEEIKKIRDKLAKECRKILEEAVADSDRDEFLYRKAKQMQPLFHVDPSVFDPCHDRECELEEGLLHRAYMVSALRSFAWTLAFYCDRRNILPEDVDLETLEDLLLWVRDREYLNYNPWTFYQGLCGCPDLHVYYVPDRYVDSLEKNLAMAEKVREPSILTIGNYIPCHAHSLEDLRNDLRCIYPAVQTLFQELKRTRDPKKPLVGDAADIVYAWCALALAARDPFFSEDGPTSNYFIQLSPTPGYFQNDGSSPKHTPKSTRSSAELASIRRRLAPFAGLICSDVTNLFGIETDGLVYNMNQNLAADPAEGWSDLIAVSKNWPHILGLRSDGTVLAKSDNEKSEAYPVSDWKGIVAISVGDKHAVGLRADGTAVAVGSNKYGQCDVSKWKGLAAISAGEDHTVGLFADGTAVAVGDNDMEQCNVYGWENLVAVSAGIRHTVGLLADGTAVAAGWNGNGECDVSNWKDLVAISAGDWHTVGLRADGTAVAAGKNNEGQCDVANWKDLVAVYAQGSVTIGLTSDGKVVSTKSLHNTSEFQLFNSADSFEQDRENARQREQRRLAKENRRKQEEAQRLEKEARRKKMTSKSTLSPAELASVREWLTPFANLFDAGNDFIGIKINGRAYDKNQNLAADPAEGWSDLIAVFQNWPHMLGLRSDGTVLAKSDDEEWEAAYPVADWKGITAISMGDAHVVGLRADGTAVAVGENDCGQCDVSDWKDLVAVSAGDFYTVGLRADGTAVAVGNNAGGQCGVSNWKDLVAVSAGSYHTVGLLADGTAVAVGYNEEGECDVSNWKNLVAVSAGLSHTVGLRADGTVVAVGENEYGQCDVSDWKDIVAIHIGYRITAGVTSDGRVIHTSENHETKTIGVRLFQNADSFEQEREQIRQQRQVKEISRTELASIRRRLAPFAGLIHGNSDVIMGIRTDGRAYSYLVRTDQKRVSTPVEDWTDLVAITEYWPHVLGLKSDGTVYAKCNYEKEYEAYQTADWKGITAISMDHNHVVVLRADGTAAAVGNNSNGQCNVSKWKDLAAISTGSQHTVGLRADGTAVAVGFNVTGQCNVSNWKDLVAVSAGNWHTVGLRADGTAVAVGSNKYGQCDVLDWKNLVAISAGNEHTVGLRADGTAAAVGNNENGQCDVSDWENLVAIHAGRDVTIGLTADGRVVSTDPKHDTRKLRLFQSADTLEQEREQARQEEIRLRHSTGLRLCGVLKRQIIEEEARQEEQRRIEEENRRRQEEQRRIEEENRRRRREELILQRESLQNELSGLRGLFKGRRKRELEDAIRQIDAELLKL